MSGEGLAAFRTLPAAALRALQLLIVVVVVVGVVVLAVTLAHELSAALAALLCAKMKAWTDSLASPGPPKPIQKTRYFQLRFEGLAMDSAREVDLLLQFLAWARTPLLEAFLRSHVGALSCPSGVYTCLTREQAHASVKKWRQALTEDEHGFFASPICRDTLQSYRYIRTEHARYEVLSPLGRHFKT